MTQFFFFMGVVFYLGGVVICAMAFHNLDDGWWKALGKFMGCLLWPMVAAGMLVLITFGWLTAWTWKERK